MRHLENPTKPSFDRVDQFAEDVVRFPDQAEALKRKFRRDLGLSKEQGHQSSEAEPEDEDAFWDNVPI